MKTVIPLLIFLLLLAPGFCWGHKVRLGPPDPPNPESLVTAISISGDSQGSITISGDSTPFVVKPGTTIIIDGHTGGLSDVQKGMQVLSRTAEGSSAPEIDLKTVQPSK